MVEPRARGELEPPPHLSVAAAADSICGEAVPEVGVVGAESVREVEGRAGTSGKIKQRVRLIVCQSNEKLLFTQVRNIRYRGHRVVELKLLRWRRRWQRGDA